MTEPEAGGSGTYAAITIHGPSKGKARGKKGQVLSVNKGLHPGHLENSV